MLRNSVSWDSVIGTVFLKPGRLIFADSLPLSVQRVCRSYIGQKAYLFAGAGANSDLLAFDAQAGKARVWPTKASLALSR
jgi:hypothetical protein